MDNFRRHPARRRTSQNTVRTAAERIVHNWIGEWKLIVKVRVIFVLARVTAGLGKGIIDIGAAGPADDGKNRVENRLAVRPAIETQMHEIAQHAPALGNAETDRMANRSGQRIVRPVPSKKRHEIADRGEAYAHDGRVARGIHEFEDRSLVEPRPAGSGNFDMSIV